MTAENVLLKIFTGQHKGALVPLKMPEVRLGDVQDVDIMLSDEVLAGTFFTLAENKDGYYLSESGETLDWSTAEVAHESGQAVLYKVSDFIFGLSSEPALLAEINPEQLTFLPYQINANSKDQSSEDQAQSGSLSSDSDSDADTSSAHTDTESPEMLEGSLEGSNEASAMTQSETTHTLRETLPDDQNDEEAVLELPDDEEESEADSLLDVINIRLILSTASVFVVVIIMGWFYFSPTEYIVSDAPPVECEQYISGFIETQGFKQIQYRALQQPKVSDTNEMVYAISGYLANTERLQRLTEITAETECKIVFTKIFFHSDIVQNIKAYLPAEMIESGLVKTTQQPGIYQIRGFSSSDKAWQLSKNRMLQDINGLRQIDDKVSTPATHLQRLTTLLNKTELKGYIHLKLVDDKIVTNMVFDPVKIQVWEAFIKRYRARNPQLPNIVMDSVNITQLGITGITLGRYPHIVLDNGEKYAQGSTLPNGSVLMSIDETGVVLSTVQGMIRYPFFSMGS